MVPDWFLEKFFALEASNDIQDPRAPWLEFLIQQGYLISND